MSSTLPVQDDPQAEQKRLHDVRAHSQLPRAVLAKRLAWAVVQATLYRCSFHTSNNWRAFLLRRFEREAQATGAGGVTALTGKARPMGISA